VLEETRRTFGQRMPFERRLEVDVQIARDARRAGDPGAARGPALAAAKEAAHSGLRELALAAWLVVASSERDLGDPAAALAGLDSARVQWEALRGRPSAPEWRERRGALGRDLVVETVDLLLAPGRGHPQNVRAAFDALQRYKARTLLERAAGPHATALPAPASLEQVQASLRSDEVLLDYLVGHDRAFVFVVTRATAGADTIRGAATLEASAGLYRELLASDDAKSHEAATAAARHLGESLLRSALPALANARHVLVSPDGALHLVPFSTLEAPGFQSGAGAWALDERVLVSTVPSASLLLAVRSPSGSREPGVMLALADSLPGAHSEARSIGGDVFRGRFVSIAGDHALQAHDLARSGAIHFAGHSVADEQSPWRSPVPFLRLDDGGVATAADVAALRLGARLAVLSSCETVDGRVVSGEGVVGLSSAFLAAGVPTVVASLWRVDDRATRRLMEVFYQSLLWGAEPAAALRAARRAVRNDPATRHPFYWAGFVIVGDGAAHAGLLPNPFSARTLSGYAAGAAVVTGITAAARRFRRRKTKPPSV
jgi:CHAT domain-containing protein